MTAYVCPRGGPHTHHMTVAAKVALRLPGHVPWRFVLRHHLDTRVCPAEKARRMAECSAGDWQDVPHGHLTALGVLLYDRPGYRLAWRLGLATKHCPLSPPAIRTRSPR